MDDIFSLSNILTACIFSLAAACMYIACAQKAAGAMQQSGYSGKKFLKWYFRKDNLLKTRYGLTFLLIVFSSALLGLCFSPFGVKWAFFASIFPFYLFPILFVFADGKYALKVPYTRTNRLLRLKVAYFLVIAIFNYILVTLLNAAAYYIKIDLVSSVRLSPAALSAVLLPYLLAFANLLCSPFERINTNRHIKRAKKKIAESGAVKIAVTGSYGKTSVKNILFSILSQKYKTAATPYSYNTPVGIAKFINGGGINGAEVIIFEMGARKTGDISELCDLVDPDYSVLTGIAPQHLETFKTVDAIITEKSVALKRAKTGFVSVSDERVCAEVKDVSAKKKVVVGKDVVVSDIVASDGGTSFTLEGFGGEITVFTKLLSEHSAYNIALAYSIAKMLNMTDEEILRGIENVDYVPHRLQKIVSGGITVLDDGYNSNAKGARDSVAVLKLFKGKKYAVTPGLVEMGILEKEANANLGKELVGLDRVILVGETLVKTVLEGYIAGGGEEDKVTVVPTLNDAKKIISEELSDGDCVLFLNDLPDVY